MNLHPMFNDDAEPLVVFSLTTHKPESEHTNLADAVKTILSRNTILGIRTKSSGDLIGIACTSKCASIPPSAWDESSAAQVSNKNPISFVRICDANLSRLWVRYRIDSGNIVGLPIQVC